jgi:transcription termination factor NusB
MKPIQMENNMSEQLSQYAEEQFVKFLQNEKLQTSINDMVVFMNVTDLDEVIEVCLTMFLANVDVSKLHLNDLNALRMEIHKIRNMKIEYPIHNEVIPEPTHQFIMSKLKERLIHNEK